MSNFIDKDLILSRIKFHYKFKTDVQLAQFLNIKPTTLANWYARNTIDFDRIFTKCEDLNPTWIVTGGGRATKGYPNLEENEPTLTEEVEEVLYIKARQKEEIERLHNMINLQGETIAAQAKTIEVMNKLIASKEG